MKKVELLAPAGNYESLIGALNAGADAVYLGGAKFGARAFAENFTTEQLVEGIKYAHLLGKKIFLTINTLVKEKEFGELYDYLMPFYEAGLDAVIVQDLGVFEYVKSMFPDMELHVSTQMTITGVYGAKLLAEMGADRIVPARELSLDEIKDIKRESGLDIETFVHGAMCYCYSGQCLFSSYLGGRSGNRGKCAQPCRLPYAVKDDDKISKSFYPLSLKDMCTIEQLPKLLEAGIDSFKIEGRMKKPEYVAGVTAIYRKYIDMYYSNPASFKVSKKDLDILRTLYIRSEILDGYYFRHNGKEMITLNSPSYSGSDEELLLRIREQYLTSKKKAFISMKAGFMLHEKAWLTVFCQEQEITVYGDIVSEAMKAPITRENIEKGLLALGDSFFACQDFELIMDNNIFYSLKAIKELRREALQQLTNVLCPVRKHNNNMQNKVRIRETLCIDSKEIAHCKKDENGVRILCTDRSHLDAYAKSKLEASHLIVESELVDAINDFELYWQEYQTKLLSNQKPIPKVLVAFPYIVRKRDYTWIGKFLDKINNVDGVLVRNLETYGYLKENSYSKTVYADAGFYVWNKETVEMFDHLAGLCLPLELSGKEQSALTNSTKGFEQIVYGHMPMMITANCVAKTAANCLKTENKNAEKRGKISLIDRMNKSLPVYTNCNHCYNVIYNSVVLSLHDKVKNGMDSTIRLNFTVESYNDSLSVMNYYASLIDNKCSSHDISFPFKDYTTGHYKKGAL